MDTVCAACLSTERKLTPVKSLYYFLNEWRSLDIKLSGGICWECKAMLKKMCSFKKKVVKAQQFLNVKINTIAKPLSSLAIHHVYVGDICAEGQELADHKNFDFKIEPAYEYDELNNEIYYEVNFEENVKQEYQMPVEKKKVRSRIYKTLQMSEEEMLKTREEDRLKSSFLMQPIKCEDCLVAYAYNKQLLMHKEKYHSKKNGSFQCSICQCYFSTDTLLMKHKKSHYTLYQCVLCKHAESTKSRILHHYNNRHRDVKDEEKGVPVEDWSQYFESCEFCDKKFIKRGSLVKHMKVHGKCFECDVCRKKFYEKKKIKSHLKWVHAVSKDDAYCVECDKHFKNIVIYKRHLQHSRKHTKDEELKHQCSECHKKFFDRTTFTRHVQKHFRIMEHKCHICVKSFIRKDQLDKHIKYIHEGLPRPKTKQCTICGRGFTRMATLLNHIRTHTGDKPFQCENCDSAFAQKSSLNSHVKAVHLKLPKKIKFEH